MQTRPARTWRIDFCDSRAASWVAVALPRSASDDKPVLSFVLARVGNEPGERTGPAELRSLVRALDHGGSTLGGELFGVPARAERLHRIRREPQPSTELVQHGPHVGLVRVHEHSVRAQYITRALGRR